MLEKYIQRRTKDRNILLMTHIVIGYPSFEKSLNIVAAMVAADVDIIELQIPFSEPIADGPVILKANQVSLEQGATVERCFEFAKQVNEQFDIPFLFMTYYNIVFKYGVSRFVERMADIGIKGAIIPDLPPDTGKAYLDVMAANGLAPVFIFTPTTSNERMRHIAAAGNGMIYCVARKGVTGAATSFTDVLDDYLARCRDATDLPLALGFGVKDTADIRHLIGKVDIAVIGTRMIDLINQDGIPAIEPFIRELRG